MLACEKRALQGSGMSSSKTISMPEGWRFIRTKSRTSFSSRGLWGAQCCFAPARQDHQGWPRHRVPLDHQDGSWQAPREPFVLLSQARGAHHWSLQPLLNRFEAGHREWRAASGGRAAVNRATARRVSTRWADIPHACALCLRSNRQVDDREDIDDSPPPIHHLWSLLKRLDSVAGSIAVQD